MSSLGNSDLLAYSISIDYLKLTLSCGCCFAVHADDSEGHYQESFRVQRLAADVGK